MIGQLNVKHKMGTGIPPQSFIDGMTSNQAEFMKWYNLFTWEGKEEASYFDSIGERKDMRCLVICTDWCPDVIWNVPVLFKVMEHGRIHTEVLPMERHLETMDLFLTDGGRAQPIAVFVNSAGDVLGRWGARPQYIQATMDEFRRHHPDRSAPDYQEKVSHVRKEIAKLYNAGTHYQAVIVQELRELFDQLVH